MGLQARKKAAKEESLKKDSLSLRMVSEAHLLHSVTKRHTVSHNNRISGDI